jgi:hypothetical protein
MNDDIVCFFSQSGAEGEKVGFLEMEESGSFGSKKWKERWFVVEKGSSILQYFDNESNHKCRGGCYRCHMRTKDLIAIISRRHI